MNYSLIKKNCPELSNNDRSNQNLLFMTKSNNGNANINFPISISFTITNACNLRCKMCGQWGEKGYVNNNKEILKHELKLADWKRLVDELVEHKIFSVLLRGGEVFLFPEIIELLDYINSKGIFTSIDTNGTLLKNYAKDLVRIGNIHLTFSIDGPEEIHDQVRGAKGCFRRIKENIALIHELEKNNSHKISKSIIFTISPYSYKGLNQMPDVARSLSIDTIVIVPYYYIPEYIGKEYEKVLDENFNSDAFSWHGFHHKNSGIDLEIFKKEYRKYLENLKEIKEFPYMGSFKEGFEENDYLVWFNDAHTPVGTTYCMNIEKFIDIQPNGDANFCTDFPDYIIGNVKESTIYEIWNSERAACFREYQRKKQLPICYRCGAKYMSEIPNKV